MILIFLWYKTYNLRQTKKQCSQYRDFNPTCAKKHRSGWFHDFSYIFQLFSLHFMKLGTVHHNLSKERRTKEVILTGSP